MVTMYLLVIQEMISLVAVQVQTRLPTFSQDLIQRVRNASNSDISELCPHMVFGAPADRQYTRLPPLISYSNAISGIIVSDV